MPPATAATSGGASATCRRASACRAIRRPTCSSSIWPSCAGCRAVPPCCGPARCCSRSGSRRSARARSARSRPACGSASSSRRRSCTGRSWSCSDEPTAGLDPAGREEMLQLVRRLSLDLGVRVLLSSHVLEDVARTCDAVVVLRDGHVVTSGPAGRAARRRRDRHRRPRHRRRRGFRAALAARGLAAEESGERLVVQGAGSACARRHPRRRGRRRAPACASSPRPCPPSRTSSSAPWRRSDGRAVQGGSRVEDLRYTRTRAPAAAASRACVVRPQERAARARRRARLARQADPVRR